MKFLLEKNFGEYDLNQVRAEKEAEQKQKEQEENERRAKSLLELKEYKESQIGKEYEKLNSTDRKYFIEDCLDNMSGSNVIKRAKLPLIDAILQTNWNEDIVKYIDNITKTKINNIDNDVVDLSIDLIANKKVNPDAQWLYNKSLYERNLDDILYTLKALAFADNKELQKTPSGKDYFSEENPLTVNDLIENGEIKGADEIVDVINGKQITATDIPDKKKKTTAKEIAKETKKPEEQVDEETARLRQKVIDDVVATFTRLGYKERESRELAEKHFKENSTVEDLVMDIFRGMKESV